MGFFRISVPLFLTLFVSIASADLAFSPTFSYEEISVKDNNEANVGSSTRVTRVDFRLGYIMPGGLYLGGLYGIENGSGTESGTNTNMSANRYGVSLGFVMGSFNLIGHYFLKGEFTSKVGDTEYKYTDGSGTQLDLGWNFMIANTIGFGPQVTYRNLTYAKRTRTAANGTITEGSNSYVRTEIEPRIAFWFLF